MAGPGLVRRHGRAVLTGQRHPELDGQLDGDRALGEHQRPAVMNPPTAARPSRWLRAARSPSRARRSTTRACRTSRSPCATTPRGSSSTTAGSTARTPSPDGAGSRRSTSGGSNYNWSYTTPFNLKPGNYSFTVRATDELGLTTSSSNQGRLTINVAGAGRQPARRAAERHRHADRLTTRAPRPGRHRDRRLRCRRGQRRAVRERDGQYVQPNGTLASGFATLPATLSASGAGATSITWTLPVDLPVNGNYSVTAYGVDTSGQQDTSTSGATATLPGVPG